MMEPKKLARIKKLAARKDWNLLDDRVDAVLKIQQQARDATMGPTFMGAPNSVDFNGIDIAMIGVPCDLGVTTRPGARFGPQQIREMSRDSSGPIHHISKIVPMDICKVIDAGDVPIDSQFNLDAAIEEIEEYFQEIVSAGVIPISAGGDHSISYPILAAVGKAEPVGLVHVDAHCDTCFPLSGSKFHQGAPFRNAAAAGVLDPERTIQIGIRGMDSPWWAFSRDSGMRIIHMEEFHEMGMQAVAEEIRRVTAGGPTYISIDVDGIDPAYTPGTSIPVVGGLTPIETQAIIRATQGMHLVGGDVVEVAPPYDPSGNTARVAATMMWEILCVVADSIAALK